MRSLVDEVSNLLPFIDLYLHIIDEAMDGFNSGHLISHSHHVVIDV